MSRRPRNDPKRRKHRGEFAIIAMVWFMLWIGHLSDNWVRSALIFTLVFAALEFMGEFIPDKEKKDEVSEVRKEDSESK